MANYIPSFDIEVVPDVVDNEVVVRLEANGNVMLLSLDEADQLIKNLQAAKRQAKDIKKAVPGHFF